MKGMLSRKSVRQSLWSLVSLGIFILVGIGSLIDGYYWPAEIYREYEGRGVYKETVILPERKKTYTGEQDSKGRYQGHYTIETGPVWHGTLHTEKVFFINGLRHGKSEHFNYAGKLIQTEYYNMGVKVGLLKSTTETKAATSAYEVLQDRYPWFSHELNAFGFDSTYLKAYLDTVELLLDQTARDEEYFTGYFNGVVSDLEETPYDSLIVLNQGVSAHLGVQEMKNSELRLAVISRFRSEGNNTYPIIVETFPNYLLSMNERSIEDADFEAFCHVLDSCMDSKGVLDLEDPFFIDSIDSWFSESLITIYESDEYDLKRASWFGNDLQKLYSETISTHKSSTLRSNPPEVASLALSLMYQRFEQGDMLKRAAREAYILNTGKIRLPVVTTEFARNNSPTSANLRGYILEDGGAEVTASGMAWASHYNPAAEDQSVPSQIKSGGFTVTLEGLTEGSTYYARSYATNSAGTAYGNCISFVATAPTAIDEHEIENYNLSIYPNPSSTVTTFSFLLDRAECISIAIIDINGRLVFEDEPGVLFPGENQIQLDLSALPNGLYTCLLINNGTAITIRNFVITH